MKGEEGIDYHFEEKGQDGEAPNPMEFDELKFIKEIDG